jgi:hypothetical protein
MAQYTIVRIRWTKYMLYRMELRKFDQEKVEHILRFSIERYFDTETHRIVVIGTHDNRVVAIPIDKTGNTIIPVTIHVITRQQIRFRKLTGRFEDEK